MYANACEVFSVSTVKLWKQSILYVSSTWISGLDVDLCIHYWLDKWIVYIGLHIHVYSIIMYIVDLYKWVVYIGLIIHVYTIRTYIGDYINEKQFVHLQFHNQVSNKNQIQ